jgi:hypothetical protein
MAEIPLPSLETIGKISGWVTEQANIWLQVVKSPKEFVSKIDLTSQSEFGKSVQFLFFVLVCVIILELPIDALRLHLHVFDATTQICNFIVMAIEALLFSSTIYLFGRAILGKGRYRNTLIAMFYSAALYPIAVFPFYLASTWDSEHLASGSALFSPDPNPVRALLFASAVLFIYVYLTVKLIPVIKHVHSFGAIRALFALGLTGVVVGFYEYLVAIPFVAELVKEASK